METAISLSVLKHLESATSLFWFLEIPKTGQFFDSGVFLSVLKYLESASSLFWFLEIPKTGQFFDSNFWNTQSW